MKQSSGLNHHVEGFEMTIRSY